MKKTILWSLLVTVVALSSCKSNLAVVPKAVNTVNAVSLSELNLERNDYKILKTESAEATIIFQQKGKYDICVKEQNGEFALYYELDKMGNWYVDSFEGIVRYGFLNNDYGKIISIDDMNVEYIARNVAIYRLINKCKVAGGDGVIEPIISMNINGGGRNEIVYKVTASAKVIKLNTDK